MDHSPTRRLAPWPALATWLLVGSAAAAPPSPAELPPLEPVGPTGVVLSPTEVAFGAPAGPPPSLLEQPDGTLLNTWLDVPHAFLERRIFGIVNGFDHFFADERDLGVTRSSSFARWRNQARVEPDGSVDPGISFRADLSLPYIQRRLKRFRLVLENAGRNLVDSEPRVLTGQTEGARADALLRFSLLDTLRASIDLGGGLLFDFPPGVVGRIRFRRAQEIGRVALARVATVGFWNSRDGFGANGSLALERSLGRGLLLRWTNGTLISQSSNGWESASELALLVTLGRTTGLTALGSAAASSKPDLAVETWRAAFRLRTAVYRHWIFGELEPEVTWPRHDPEGRRWVPAIILRLEIQFEEARSGQGVAATRGAV